MFDLGFNAVITQAEADLNKALNAERTARMRLEVADRRFAAVDDEIRELERKRDKCAVKVERAKKELTEAEELRDVKRKIFKEEQGK